MASKEEVIECLRTVLDPELWIDVWTLGLIYDIHLEGATLDITMTFTSIACPAGPQLVEDIKTKTSALSGIEKVNVTVVFQPPWEPSDELKAMMGIY